jgi:hypothetical protein
MGILSWTHISSWTAAMTVGLLAFPLAHAQQPGPATSAGPGRITCKTATTCEVGIGTPATLRFLVNVEGLPSEDKDRLGKQCKPSGKAMCIVTVQGTEMGDPMKVRATKITWYN